MHEIAWATGPAAVRGAVLRCASGCNGLIKSIYAGQGSPARTATRAAYLTRLAQRLLLSWLLCLVFCALPASARAGDTDAVTWLTNVEAVRAPWDSHTPPETGWVPAELPDSWSERWPGFEGVVWYRLRWVQKDATVPIGI